MDKARKKFVLFSELSVLLLLTVLLTVINGINFAMAAEDADHLTEQIMKNHGYLNQGVMDERLPPNDSQQPPDNATDTAEADSVKGAVMESSYRPFNGGNRMGMMGPDSAEMHSSLPYFTVAFGKKDQVETVAFRMTALDEAQAVSLARSLLSGSTGWTNITYRYRVYTDQDRVYVTVIDQSRELWPCYRILIISAIGGCILLLLSLVLFHFIGKRMFRPLAEADHRQEQFIKRLEGEFKTPLTIINAETESLEIENGSTVQTASINKQVKRMTRLVKELGALSVFAEPRRKTRVELSEMMTAMLENSRADFTKKKLSLTLQITPDITLSADNENMAGMIGELISNAQKYAVSDVVFTLTQHRDRIRLTASNDTTLKNGSYDQIFDRFVTLSNAADGSTGLGLAYVREVVRECDGRVSAAVKDGRMQIEIDL